MIIVRANGTDFHVEERGAGSPIVLLHGFTGSCDSWGQVGDALASRHRVIAIDLLGHGRSSAPSDLTRYAFELGLDDLAEIGRQFGVGRATWLGYSMGGRLALGLTLRHPRLVSSLILESATPGIQDEAERLERATTDEALARRIEDSGIPAFVEEWERLPMWESQRALPAHVLQMQRQRRLLNNSTGLANSLRGMGQGAQPSYWDRLGEIQAPVLLIAGSLDRKFTGIAGQIGIRIPGAELCVIPQAGHAVHLEQPEEFAASVLEFLAAQDCFGISNGQESHRWT